VDPDVHSRFRIGAIFWLRSIFTMTAIFPTLAIFPMLTKSAAASMAGKNAAGSC